MSAERRQELLDLLLGELEPKREDELKQLVNLDPELQSELNEIEALFGLMRKGEEIEFDPAVHATIMREAHRVTRPSLASRLASLPGLFRFRFQRSVAFRVAAISLAAHLVVVAVLWQVQVFSAGPDDFGANDVFLPSDLDDLPVPDYRPDRGFVLRLGRARVSRSVRLKRFGVDGQHEAIRDGVDALLTQQKSDGSFGSTGETAQAALVLLGEGANSTDPTTRGKAVREAVRSMLREVDSGKRDGFMLSALIEDWVFSYEHLTEEERTRYIRAMQKLIPTVDGEGAAESLILAELAGLPVPSDHSGDMAVVLGGSAWDALDRTPSRLSATALIARMQEDGEESVGFGSDALRNWVAPAFQDALADGKRGDANALLLLQSPYRL